MGTIKEHYHEEICQMSEHYDDVEYLELLQAEDEEIERSFKEFQEDIKNSELPSFLHPKF